MNSAEENTFPTSSSSSSASHKYEGSTTVQCLCRRIHPGRSLQKPQSSRSCRAGWAHNVWEGCLSPRSNTPHLAGALWISCSAFSTSWKLKFEQRTGRSERERRGTEDEDKTRKQQTLRHVMTCGWTWFMQTRRATPWATMWCVHKDESVEKESRVRVFCPQKLPKFENALQPACVTQWHLHSSQKRWLTPGKRRRPWLSRSGYLEKTWWQWCLGAAGR